VVTNATLAGSGKCAPTGGEPIGTASPPPLVQSFCCRP
jgi:hypothetical protein